MTDFGATCNGTGNDERAFAAFNSWASTWQMTNTGLITLVIPSGAVCEFNGTGGGQYPFLGIANVLISGYGATFSDNNGMGNGWFAAGKGVSGVAGFSARLGTVQAGSSSVTLLTPSQISLFTVGNWALITGLDTQGAGSYPPNPAFFEYVHISAINSGTGVISFSDPLKNTYESTWPLYICRQCFSAR